MIAEYNSVIAMIAEEDSAIGVLDQERGVCFLERHRNTFDQKSLRKKKVVA